MNFECDGGLTAGPDTFYVVKAKGDYMDFSAPVGGIIWPFSKATRFGSVSAALEAIQRRVTLLGYPVSSLLQIVRVEATQAPGTSCIHAVPVEEPSVPGDLLVIITKDRHGEIIARARHTNSVPLALGPYYPNGHGNYLDSVLKPDDVLSMWKKLKADFAYSTVQKAAAMLARFPEGDLPRFVAIRRLRLTYQAGKVEYRETTLA